MGRLTDNLRAEIKTRVPAKAANLRMQDAEIRRFARFAPTPDPQLQRLLEIIRDEGLSESLLARDHGDLTGIPDNALRAYIRMVAENLVRESGGVPADETATMLCAKCGPVWTAPEVAFVLPRVDGWSRALGCPWCHLRSNGIAIRRPPVMCGDCKHFIRDQINPFAGAGKCGVGVEQHRIYPAALQVCGAFRPTAAPT